MKFLAKYKDVVNTVIMTVVFVILFVACMFFAIVVCLENGKDEVTNTVSIQQINIELEPLPEPEMAELIIPEPERKYFNVPLSKDLQNHIFELCEEHNIEPSLVVAMIFKESTYRASAVADSGSSLGLMQIQPRWHQHRMDRLNCPNLLDPYQNITVGIDILSGLFACGNSTEWVLMAYNGGAGYAYNNIANGIVSDYARSIIAHSNQLKGEIL